MLLEAAISAPRTRNTVAALARDVWSLAKPRLSSLVVCTAAGGMWLAPGTMPVGEALVALTAIAFLVFAANATNCYLERDADALMVRTAKRPLANGRLDPLAVLIASTTTAILAVCTLAVVSNVLTAILGVIAYVSYVSAYTPLKRASSLAVFVGAIPGAIPPLMGWTLVTNRLDPAGLVLFAILFLWQIPHFVAISLYRRDDYLRGGFKTLPLVLSDRATKLILVGMTAPLVPTSLLLVPLGVEASWYAIAATVLGAGFLAINVSGLRDSAGSAWARRSLHASLVYLTLLFAAIAIGAY